MRIETAHNVGIDVEVAGLGDRVLAALIDYVLLGFAFMGVMILFALHESLAVAVVTVIPLVFYFLLCEVFFDGQSIGKRLRGVRVARIDGTQPRLGDYVLRWLLRLVEIDATSGLVALVAVLVGGKGQRLGDMAAGTTVIKVQRRVGLGDTLYARVDAQHQTTFPQVDRLTDAEVETAKEVLRALVEEGRTHTAAVMGARMKATLEARMGVRSDLDPPAFLRAVLLDYNHLHGRL